MSLSLIVLNDSTAAVTGDTAAHLQELKNLGGKYQRNMVNPSDKTIFHGYRFDTKSPNYPSVLELVNGVAAPAPAVISERRPVRSAVAAALPQQEVTTTDTPSTKAVDYNETKIYSYSDASYGIFGNTDRYRTKLNEYGAKENPRLKHPITGLPTNGFVLSKRSKHYQEVLKLIGADGVTVPAVTAPVYPFSLYELQTVSCFELANYCRETKVDRTLEDNNKRIVYIAALARAGKVDPRLAVIVLSEDFYDMDDDELIADLARLNIPYFKGMTHFGALCARFVYSKEVATNENIALLKEMTSTFVPL